LSRTRRQKWNWNWVNGRDFTDKTANWKSRDCTELQHRRHVDGCSRLSAAHLTPRRSRAAPSGQQFCCACDRVPRNQFRTSETNSFDAFHCFYAF